MNTPRFNERCFDDLTHAELESLYAAYTKQNNDVIRVKARLIAITSGIRYLNDCLDYEPCPRCYADTRNAIKCNCAA
jgi:hypothetical protein